MELLKTLLASENPISASYSSSCALQTTERRIGENITKDILILVATMKRLEVS